MAHSAGDWKRDVYDTFYSHLDFFAKWRREAMQAIVWKVIRLRLRLVSWFEYAI